MHLEGYGLPGASSVAYGLTCMELEAGDAGIRSLVSVQGSLAMYAIWRWGSEEQKQRWLPPMHERRRDRLLRPDRARRRLRSRRDAHPRAPRRLRLGPQRDEDVDHERLDRRRRGRLGEDRRRADPRLPRRARDARVRGAGDAPQDLAPRVGHVRARPSRRARAGGEPLPRGVVAARPALVPERGALRHRLGIASARRARASRRRSSTRRSASSSASRSPATSSRSRSSPRWRSRSTARRSSRSTSAA